MNFLILLASLGVVTLGAEVLVRSSSILALRAGVSALFVGLTIVGFGTSSPELSASLVATLNGNMGVSVGNVVGSNIFNVAFILALTAVVKPIRVGLSAVRRDLGVAIVASFLLLLPAVLGGVVPRWLGALMFTGLVAYLTTAYKQDRQAKPTEQALAEHELRSSLSLEEPGRKAHSWYDSTAMHCVIVVGGLALLVLGAKWFVGSAITIARGYGMPEDVIGLTIISVGTSLPELVTSVVAARRGNPDIAVGNVIGSSIFNLLGIAGISAMVAPQVVSPEMLRVDIPVMILTVLALVPIMRTGHSISRREGAGLLLGYCAYLTYLLVARTG
jgi:cation:H+ antiporter